MIWLFASQANAEIECFSENQCYQLILPSEETKHMFVFLHGLGDSAENFVRASIVQTVLGSMKQGDTPPSVMLIPEGDRGYWINWTDGMHLYEDWMLDTVQRIAKDYDIETISLVGVSMGGFGALSIGLRNPALFDKIVAYSPTDMEIAITLRPDYQLYTSMFGDVVYKEYAFSLNPRELVLRGSGHDQEIFWIVGDAEPEKFLQGSVRLKAASEAQGLEPKIRIVPNGTHSFENTWNEESTNWWLKEIEWE
jgi:S-formylglutathione hydrolase FrmB